LNADQAHGFPKAYFDSTNHFVLFKVAVFFVLFDEGVAFFYNGLLELGLRYILDLIYHLILFIEEFNFVEIK